MITRYAVWPAVARGSHPSVTKEEADFVIAALRLFRKRADGIRGGEDTILKIKNGITRDLDLLAAHPKDAGAFLVERLTGGWCASWVDVHPEEMQKRTARI